MSPKQRVLFVQLQIALAGALIALFGFLWREGLLALFGILIVCYGAVRAVMLSKIISSDSSIDENLDLDAIIEQAKKEAGETDEDD